MNREDKERLLSRFLNAQESNKLFEIKVPIEIQIQKAFRPGQYNQAELITLNFKYCIQKLLKNGKINILVLNLKNI